ncbi:hypothetical protein J6590_063383 [Homalodisca vitripennis]|nr:hypothetical protein J6590_063383 [Homalodisca vitripennis]
MCTETGRILLIKRGLTVPNLDAHNENPKRGYGLLYVGNRQMSRAARIQDGWECETLCLAWGWEIQDAESFQKPRGVRGWNVLKDGAFYKLRTA